MSLHWTLHAMDHDQLVDLMHRLLLRMSHVRGTTPDYELAQLLQSFTHSEYRRIPEREVTP